jgi:hypothetical protein
VARLWLTVGSITVPVFNEHARALGVPYRQRNPVHQQPIVLRSPTQAASIRRRAPRSGWARSRFAV